MIRQLAAMLMLACALTACEKKAAPSAAAPPPEPATALARTHASDMPAAYHEFQVFGDKATYLSHYPMFASIHAYQVVAEAKLPPEARQALTAFRAAHPGIGVSISPSIKSEAAVPQRDDWVLPAEIKPGRVFNADMHWVAEGDDFADPAKRHYLARNIPVEITRVIRKQMFYPDTPKSPALSYLAVGTPDDLYLVHILDRYPDFDQVLKAQAIDDAVPPSGAIVTISGHANTPADRLKPGDRAEGKNAKGRSVRAKIVSELGFEDLEIQH
ncbi:MAG: hypothetical protein ACXW3D_02485 [Caulobacteraceae bacterium]